jgi:RNA polymerase subunit RPABC4/transcription elongation factor Spt4
MVTFCPKCGNKISNTQSLFCIKCGTRLSEHYPEKIEEIESKKCSNCGVIIPNSQSNFCEQCQSPALKSSQSQPIKLKLLTEEWRGDLLIILSILYAIVFYVTIVIPRGFLMEDIIYYVIFGLPVAIIIFQSFIQEKPRFSKKGGLHFSIFTQLYTTVYFAIYNFFGTGSLYVMFYLIVLILITFGYLAKLGQKQSHEIRRTCKYCGKVWHSSTSRESNLVSGIGWDSGIGAVGFFSSAGKKRGISATYSQSRRNVQAQREVLENLRRCPNCGSSKYTEEMVHDD